MKMKTDYSQIPHRNIAVIAGGDSSEWVIAERSAEGVTSFLDNGRYHLYTVVIRNKSWSCSIKGEIYVIDKNDFSIATPAGKINFDFAYITIHGTPGENGLLQGYFDMLGIPYSSCGVLASSLTFNKYICNNYLKGYGINISPSIVVKSADVNPDDIVAAVGLPCFIKPNAGGSSFGTTKVKRQEEVIPSIVAALNEGSEAIIEAFIEGTEVTCGCYKVNGECVVLPLTEVVSKNEFFDFEAKYTASKVDEITPARISEKLTNEIQRQTLCIYEAIGAKGIIRADFIIRQNTPVLLEVNTTPGMTRTSFIPQQIKAAGLDITEVFTSIVENEF